MTKICHLTIVTQKSIPRIIKEAKSAINNGYIVYVVSPGPTYKCNDGIEFIGLDEPKNRLKRFLSTDKKIIKLALETNSDIYQVHDPELLRFYPLLKKNNKKVIFDSHEFYSYQILSKPYIPKILRPLVALLYRGYENFILKRIDYIIGVCTVNGKNLFAQFQDSILIANYPYIDSNQTDLFNNDNSKNNQIIYSGLLSPSRGISQIVIASYISKTKLVLCGPWMTEEYQKEIISMKEFEYTEYLGVLDNVKLKQVYKDSTIGISTLLPVGQYHIVDTLPTKAYEYMSYGLPVIMSNNDYFNSLNISDPFGISVNPYNPQEIAEAITYLNFNTEIRRRFGMSGLQLSQRSFNWDTEGKKLIEVYKKVI